MARSHVMTPARKAALRKAQLVSARKRRRGGVKNELKRAGRQTLSAARAGGSVASRKAVRKFNSPANKTKRRSALKRVGRGLAVGAVIGAPTAALIAHSELRGSHRRIRNETKRAASIGPRRVTSVRGVGSPLSSTRALTMGSKGRSTVRSRNYRARKKVS